MFEEVYHLPTRSRVKDRCSSRPISHRQWRTMGATREISTLGTSSPTDIWRQVANGNVLQTRIAPRTWSRILN